MTIRAPGAMRYHSTHLLCGASLEERWMQIGGWQGREGGGREAESA